MSEDGEVAFTLADTQRPADVALIKRGKTARLTQLNEDALGDKELAKVEEIWVKSSHDGLAIQGWIAYPPGFDKNKKYPLVLEIHGGLLQTTALTLALKCNYTQPKVMLCCI